MGGSVELGRRGDEPLGDDALREGHTVAIGVCQERLDGADALTHTSGEVTPLLGVDDPRDQVEREGSLHALEGEGHPSFGEGPSQLV